MCRFIYGKKIHHFTKSSIDSTRKMFFIIVYEMYDILNFKMITNIKSWTEIKHSVEKIFNWFI